VLTKLSTSENGVDWAAPSGGVPTGGTSGQILAKLSENDYDTQWITGGGGGGPVGETGQFTFNDGVGLTGSSVLYYDSTGPTGTTGPGPTIYIGADLVPTEDIKYDLGCTGRAFRDLYLSGASIHLGGSKISVVDNVLNVNSNPIQTTFIYKYDIHLGDAITITPPSGAAAGRLTISGGGGAGGGGTTDIANAGGGGAGGCSIHMIPAVEATLTLGEGGATVNPDVLDGNASGGGGEAGGTSSYIYTSYPNLTSTTISAGGGGGGASSVSNGEGGPGNFDGAGGTVISHGGKKGTSDSEYSFFNYTTTPFGDGGSPDIYSPGRINPLGGYGGRGRNYNSGENSEDATDGAGGFAIIEWLFYAPAP
jgi:hypothetical protein